MPFFQYYINSLHKFSFFLLHFIYFCVSKCTFFSCLNRGFIFLARFRFNYDLPDTTICQNDSIIINSLTTASSYAYNWSPNYNISNNTLASPLFYPDTTTIYTLDITNTYGCTYTDSFTINVDSTANVIFPSIPQLCVGDSAIDLNLSPFLDVKVHSSLLNFKSTIKVSKNKSILPLKLLNSIIS